MSAMVFWIVTLCEILGTVHTDALEEHAAAIFRSKGMVAEDKLLASQKLFQVQTIFYIVLLSGQFIPFRMLLIFMAQQTHSSDHS
jgi:hypothetical protein